MKGCQSLIKILLENVKGSPKTLSTSFIFQFISMAVQRGNVQCVKGAYGEFAFEELDEILILHCTT